MKSFLEKKHVQLDPRVYFIEALGAMAYGLFASLLVGTILKTLGDQLSIAFLSETLWPLAQSASGPAIAVAIAYALQAPPLVVFAATVVGLGGFELGGPIGVYLATLVGVEFGKLISGETKIDIVLTPVVTVLTGMFIATFVGPPINQVMISLGQVITLATAQQPLIMGAIVSVIVGMTLTLPISSAALCMMLSLSGLAAGAATIGCSAQMIGFAVISYRDNGVNGFIAQGLGTSMLQIPNIVKNWRIWIPPTLSSLILSPLATLVFKLENTPLGAGMGTSGLVGQIGTIESMGGSIPMGKLFAIILACHIILPGLSSWVIYKFMRHHQWIKDGDMKLEM